MNQCVGRVSNMVQLNSSHIYIQLFFGFSTLLGVPPWTMNFWIMRFLWLLCSLTLHRKELTRVDLWVCRFRGDLFVEVGKTGWRFYAFFFPCVVLFFLRNALVFMANKESFLGILEYFLFLLQFFFSIFFRHGFLLGGWRVETRNCEVFFSIWSHLWPHTGWGRLPDLTLGRIPVQALAFGMVNCGPRRFAICLEGVGGRKFSNYLRSTRFRLNIAGGESWNHL